MVSPSSAVRAHRDASSRHFRYRGGVYEDGIHEDFEALAYASVGALPDLALAHPRHARAVHVPRSSREIPKALARCHGLMMLDGPESKVSELPAWLAKLDRLRTVSFEGARGIASVPPAVLGLPRLRYLGLAYTRIASLDGLERSTTVERVSIEGTPLQKDKAKLEALLAKLPKGTKVVREYVGPDLEKGAVIFIPRAASPWKAANRAALADKIREDALPNDVALGAVDLSGQVFEDVCLSEQTLVRANLRRSTWKFCELGRMLGPVGHAKTMGQALSRRGPSGLDGANLEGAVFEDCLFVGTNLRNVKAKGAVFRRCRFVNDVALDGADLREAQIELLDDPSVRIRNANATKMVFTASFAAPGFSRSVVFDKVDLRDATVSFRLADGKRPRPGRNAEWDKKVRGCKTSPGTTISWGEAPVAPRRGISLDGARPAEPIGRFAAENASLWGLIADPTVAAAWKGDAGWVEDDAPLKSGVSMKNRATDFGRAMDLEEGAIAVGREKAVIASLGGCGVSEIWRIDRGIALIAHFPSDGFDDLGKKGLVELGKRVTGLPTFGKSRRLGRVQVRSGCIALVLPYESGATKASEVEAAAKRAKATRTRGGPILVPLPNGVYDVMTEAVGNAVDFEDELGSYEARVRIVRQP